MKKFAIVPAAPEPEPVDETAIALREFAASIVQAQTAGAQQFKDALQTLTPKQWSRLNVHIVRDENGDMADLVITKMEN